MAEEDGGGEEMFGSMPDSGSTATAIVLDTARDDPSLKRKTETFLDAQVSLIDLQKHHLYEQFKQLRLRLLEQRLGVLLRVMTAVVGLAVAVGLGAAIWNAAHDNGLVIEAFSVPPDMAARGLTGQAVAAQLLDKLAAMQDATNSARPAGSYTNNWGDDIKVQIPETGVSIGQLYGLLVTWLGRETHVTGEVFRTANGIAIAARGGGDGGAMVTGSEADLDKLLQQAAEKIYERTQPYRYAIYLESPSHRDFARTREILQSLSVEGAPRDRAWAYNGLGVLDQGAGDFPRAIADLHQAMALVPDFAIAYGNLEYNQANLGHDEAALALARTNIRLLQKGGDLDMSERARAIILPQEQSNVAFALNDFTASLQYSEVASKLPDYSSNVESARETIAVDLALLHDGSAARQAWRDLPSTTDLQTRVSREGTQLVMAYWLEEWSSILAMRPDLETDTLKSAALPGGSAAFANSLLALQIWPYVATAMAMTGDFKGAHALIDKTPLDCYTCVRNRADIDTAERNWGGAEYWFANAVRQAPSIPLGYFDWGRMLMAKGDLDGAIAKFAAAHQKDPHFADPLELWGEALMLKNRSDLALAKLAEAEKYAPNWGRLHLKWGEALFWLGRKDEAAVQFANASRLDLSAADKSELARIGAKHG